MKTHTISYRGEDYDFIIEEFATNEWFWSNDYSECENLFPSQSEALADAIRWVKAREEQAADQREAEEEVRVFGSYDDQVRAEYRAGVRLNG